MVTTLSFVPSDDIDRHVDILATTSLWELVLVLNWFEDNYIGRPHQRGTGRQPLFSTEMWNVCKRTLRGEDRTNNHVEALDRRLRGELGMLHPTRINMELPP